MKKLKKENKTVLDITKFKFLKDLLLVKALRPEDGELIDPAQYEDKPEFGEVVKVGDDVKDISKGDIIHFGKYSTLLIRSKRQDYYIVRSEDVNARL